MFIPVLMHISRDGLDSFDDAAGKLPRYVKLSDYLHVPSPIPLPRVDRLLLHRCFIGLPSVLTMSLQSKPAAATAPLADRSFS